jgi:hypothetical protein
MSAALRARRYRGPVSGFLSWPVRREEALLRLVCLRDHDQRTLFHYSAAKSTAVLRAITVALGDHGLGGDFDDESKSDVPESGYVPGGRCRWQGRAWGAGPRCGTRHVD